MRVGWEGRHPLYNGKQGYLSNVLYYVTDILSDPLIKRCSANFIDAAYGSENINPGYRKNESTLYCSQLTVYSAVFYMQALSNKYTDTNEERRLVLSRGRKKQNARSVVRNGMFSSTIQNVEQLGMGRERERKSADMLHVFHKCVFVGLSIVCVCKGHVYCVYKYLSSPVQHQRPI